MNTKPLLTATARASRRTETMTDNFYMNGSLPPCGSVPVNKPFSKDIRAKLSVFAVSDGYGSEDTAANAAHKVLSVLKKHHDHLGTVTVEAIHSVIEPFTEEANSFMQSLGTDAGASLAMLVISHGVATALNTGNARVYSFKYGRLNRLTVDDTETQHLLNIGAIRREEAKDHVGRRTLTASIGKLNMQEGQKMHMSSPMPVESGDIFLLCSNGLSDYLSDDRISYILSLRMSNERLAQRLVSEAIARGADDNLTVVIVRSGKNVKPSRVNKGLLKIGVCVILLAILAAYLLSKPWADNAPYPAEETPTVSPSPTPASVLSSAPPVDQGGFELRE